jgi:hypothetical protein
MRACRQANWNYGRQNAVEGQVKTTSSLDDRQSRYPFTRRETSMTLIWLGVLLVFGGMLQMAFQPIWHGRLSGRRRLRGEQPSDTLEPASPAGGFELKSNWPGLLLVALGAAFLLAGATI